METGAVATDLRLFYPWKGRKPEGLTSERIMEYASERVEHFKNLITLAENGCNSVRPGECTEYLFCWQSIQEKNGEWDKLSLTERGEVMDNYYENEGEFEEFDD